MKLNREDLPVARFTYTLTPLTDKLVPVDWKLLVTTESIECQNIRCHKLHASDNLLQLIGSFQRKHAVAVVLINTSDNYFLHPSFLEKTQGVGNFPVLLLTESDGMKLLNMVKQSMEDMYAKISVESFVDLSIQRPTGELEETRKGSTHTTSDHMPRKEPGLCVVCMSAYTCKQSRTTDTSIGILMSTTSYVVKYIINPLYIHGSYCSLVVCMCVFVCLLSH